MRCILRALMEIVEQVVSGVFSNMPFVRHATNFEYVPPMFKIVRFHIYSKSDVVDLSCIYTPRYISSFFFIQNIYIRGRDLDL